MIKKQLNLHTDMNQNTNSKTNALTLCALAYNFSVLKYRLPKHKFIHTILIFSSISTTGNIKQVYTYNHGEKPPSSAYTCHQNHVQAKML